MMAYRPFLGVLGVAVAAVSVAWFAFASSELTPVPLSPATSSTVSAPEPRQGSGMRFETFSLENGLQVVVAPNHRVPALTHMLMFRIGSADEPRGISGLAHYLEHMMFKGTKTLKVGEYSQKMAKFGGDHNAFTSNDYTGYYVTIAKEHLPMVMETEADRMVNLQVDDAEFLKERQVIMEERSMRTDNQPAAQLHEQMMASLFLNHPYRIPVIGWRHEMEALSREQVFDMYHRYYYPNNAILVVVGDMTAEELKPLAEKYYGHLPKGEELTREWTQDPPAAVARRMTLRDAKVQQPMLVRYYMAPSFRSGKTDMALPLTLLAPILGGSQTSVLHRALVVERKLAASVDVSYNGLDIGPSLLSIEAVPVDGVNLETLERALDEELALFQSRAVPADDLARAKTLTKAELIYAREGLKPLAYLVGVVWAIGLDGTFLNQLPDQVMTVTEAHVKEASAEVLKLERSVTGWLLPVEVPVVAEKEGEQKEKPDA